MAKGYLWQRVSRLFKRRAKLPGEVVPDFKPSCHVYAREDGTWIFPVNTKGGAGGGLGVMVGPSEKVQPGAAAALLGGAVLAALGRSRFELVELGNWEIPNAAKEAGFRSHADLERGAAMLSVVRTGDALTISPWAASDGGGHVPITGAERTCVVEPSPIGELILELAKACVSRRPVKSRRKLGSNTASRQNAVGEDVPISFGYKTSWIAVPQAEPLRLAQLIGHGAIERCTWKEGTRRAYDLLGIFITPAVDGWTIAMGSLPEAGTDSLKSVLESLSREFGEAFYFGTHRVVGYQAWARAEGGVLRRSFAFLGERGELLSYIGERTAEEIELDTGTNDVDNAPDEETVLALAARWVLDPRRIEEYEAGPGPGYFAERKAIA